MILSSKCAPTVIFIGFSLIQILLDIYNGIIESAFIKFIIMVVLGTVINILCDIGYNVIAWFLVFIPIIMMTLISTLLLKVVASSPDEKITNKQLDLPNGKIPNDSIDKNNNLDLDNSVNETIEDNKNGMGRLDRNLHRNNFYDNVDIVYDLTTTHQNDLRNNPIKYNIVNNIINGSEYNYVANNSSVFNKNNYLSANARDTNDEPIPADEPIPSDEPIPVDEPIPAEEAKQRCKDKNGLGGCEL